MGKSMVTRWKCDRCGEKEYTQAQSGGSGNPDSYWHMKLPEHWNDPYGMILCPDCKVKFHEFLSASKQEG